MRTEQIDRSPARLSSTLAVFAAVMAAVASGFGALVALAAGSVGVLLVTAGAVRGSRRVLAFGVGALFLGVAFGGLGTGSVESSLLAMAATMLAWDFGEQAINVGEQLGREADTRRGEVTHAAASTLLAASAVAVGYLIYAVATGGQPVAALILLLVGAVFLTMALRD